MKQNISDPQLRKPTRSGTGRANKGEAIRDLSKGRICSYCKIYKDRINFFEHPSGFNGLLPRCKDCLKIIGKTPRAKSVKKARYDKRKNSSECVKCGSTELVSNVHCRDCWFIDKATQRAGGVKNITHIIALWEEQGGRCFYSGELLVPGDNASLDHQIPRADGGISDPSNLKWVSRNINMMKSHMGHDEFIAMCEQIVKRFKE